MTETTAFEQAMLDNYLNWLNGYSQKNGNPTYYFDCLWKSKFFLIATRDFSLKEGGSPKNRYIIVPEKFELIGGDPGNNHIYFLKNYIYKGPWRSPLIPLFKDKAFQGLSDKFLKAARKQIFN